MPAEIWNSAGPEYPGTTSGCIPPGYLELMEKQEHNIYMRKYITSITEKIMKLAKELSEPDRSVLQDKRAAGAENEIPERVILSDCFDPKTFIKCGCSPDTGKK